MKRIPVQFVIEPAALPLAEATKFLGCSRTTLWRRANLPAGDPRRIARTSYGTFPIESLRRHLQAEISR